MSTSPSIAGRRVRSQASWTRTTTPRGKTSRRATSMPSAADVERIRRIVARIKKYGRDVQVTYVSGWQNRGAPFGRVPVGMIDHHDASASSSGTWGALGVVTSGRPGLPGPLSQFFVARGSVPRIAVVAAGRANHAGSGGPKVGVPRDSGNAYLYGT